MTVRLLFLKGLYTPKINLKHTKDNKNTHVLNQKHKLHNFVLSALVVNEKRLENTNFFL